MTAVKMTSILDKLIAIIAPHYCYGCNREGELLCEACQESVVTNEYLHCINCQIPTSATALCDACLPMTPVDYFAVGGVHQEALERLIHGYKFGRQRAAYQPLAAIMKRVIPYGLGVCLVVPVPTASSHIRVRGYDHAHLLAKTIAKTDNRLQLYAPLYRRHNLRQVGATRAVRRQQADSAFGCRQSDTLNDATVILVDDVTTTGATILAAARLLKEQGAARVIAAVAAQQPR